MADLTLSDGEKIPDEVGLQTMQVFPSTRILTQELLNAVMQTEEADIAIVSRWIRVVIQLSLAQNSETTEGLIPQLLQLCRNERVRTTEAHWIAVTLWNKALDYYGWGAVEIR